MRAKHRLNVEPFMHPYPTAFRPKHCNGHGDLICLHDHPDDKSPWRWLQGWRTA